MHSFPPRNISLDYCKSTMKSFFCPVFALLLLLLRPAHPSKKDAMVAHSMTPLFQDKYKIIMRSLIGVSLLCIFTTGPYFSHYAILPQSVPNNISPSRARVKIPPSLLFPSLILPKLDIISSKCEGQPWESIFFSFSFFLSIYLSLSLSLSFCLACFQKCLLNPFNRADVSKTMQSQASPPFPSQTLQSYKSCESWYRRIALCSHISLASCCSCNSVRLAPLSVFSFPLDINVLRNLFPHFPLYLPHI